jgi:hypothetical protein
LWKIYHGIPLSKRDGEDITMLTQTRNFPTLIVSQKMERLEILEFQGELQKPSVTVPDFLWTVSSSIGKEVQEMDEPLRPHISASFSASLEHTRSEGGKGVEILRKFVEYYVRTPATQKVNRRTWFGREYWLQQGIPPMYTMCRDVALDIDFRYFLSSSFRTWDASDTLADAQMNGAFSSGKVEEPIFGLDREFAPQLHQLSLELCIQNGYLGKLLPFYDPDQVIEGLSSIIGDKPIPARAHCVSEPGGKRRWITMEPSYVNMACQPLAHMLAGMLSNIPTLFSAFNRSWKAWDFADMLSIRENPNLRKWSVGVYDLTSASNNLDRGCMRIILHGLLSARYGGSKIWPYVEIILSLVFRNRIVEIHEGDSPSSPILHRFTATNGLLMGNAMTKEILVLCSEVVHRHCRYSIRGVLRPSIAWLIAGDDVACYGPRHQFELLKKTHRRLGNIIKDEKSFFSEVWVPFCQGGLHLEGQSLFNQERLMRLSYEVTICTDTIMSRLLVPFGLESLEANPTARNPVIGKGAALKKLLDYYPRKERIAIAIRIFHRNMGSMISNDIMSFLPGSIGGYECPHLISKDELWRRVMEEAPPVLFPLFKLLTDEQRSPIWLDLLLRRARTGISSRGIENPTLDPLIQSYEFALTNCAMVKYYSWSEIEAKTVARFEEQNRNLLELTPREIRKTAKKLNLMNGFDFADIVDRSSALRIFFLVAMDIIPLDRALPGKGRLFTPSEILEEFTENELSERIKRDYLTKISTSFTVDAGLEGYNAFKRWFEGGMADINSNIGTRYLPKSCYTDSLNGMYVPIWEDRRQDEPYVKGSYKDPYREIDQDLFIGTVISLNRVG